MRLIRRAHLFVAWAFVAGVILQVFLAGLGVFDSPARFVDHVTWGYTLEILPVLLLALAAIGRLGRRQVTFAAALFGMFILQSILVALRADFPMVAALHPVNGFAILFLGTVAAREAWAAREASESRGAAAVAAASTAGR